MKASLIYKIPSLRNSTFFVGDDTLFFQNKNYEVIKLNLSDNLKNLFFKFEGNAILQMQHFENLLILHDGGRFSFKFVEIENGNEVQFREFNNLSLVLNAIHNKALCIYKRNSQGERVGGLYGLVEQNIKWLKPMNQTSVLCLDNYYVIREWDILKGQATSIRNFSSQTGEEIWHYDTTNTGMDSDVGKGGDTRSLIGVIEDKLLVWTNPFCILAINIHSGILEWQIPNFSEFLPRKNFSHRTDLLLSHQSNKLIGFSAGIDFEIKLSSGELTIKNDLWDSISQTERIHAHRAILHGENIYFTGNFGNIYRPLIPNIIAAYNRKKTAVEWYDTIQDNEAVFEKSPVFNNGILGISDSKSNIHIYQFDEKSVNYFLSN